MEQNGAAATPVMTSTNSQPVTTSNNAQPAMVGNNDKKEGNGLKIALIVALVLAIGGIGFGIYGVIDGAKKDEQITELKNQLNEAKEQNSKNNTQSSGTSSDGSDDDSTTTGSDSDNTEVPTVKLTDARAKDLIEQKRESLGYNTWTTGMARLTMRGDNYYYLVAYTQVESDGTTTELSTIFHYENGEWVFDLPGSSGYTADYLEQYNFRSIL